MLIRSYLQGSPTWAAWTSCWWPWPSERATTGQPSRDYPGWTTWCVTFQWCRPSNEQVNIIRHTQPYYQLLICFVIVCENAWKWRILYFLNIQGLNNLMWYIYWMVQYFSIWGSMHDLFPHSFSRNLPHFHHAWTRYRHTCSIFIDRLFLLSEYEATTSTEDFVLSLEHPSIFTAISQSVWRSLEHLFLSLFLFITHFPFLRNNVLILNRDAQLLAGFRIRIRTDPHVFWPARIRTNLRIRIRAKR